MTPHKHPKVTVITVNYNQERYIAPAIDSILNQSFDDFEVIIIDDGSEDNSVDIIGKIADAYPNRIRFSYHKDYQNRGISDSYALGISMAKGEYVAFLEADDRWDTNFLKKKVEILDQYPDVGVVFSPYKIVSRKWYGCDMAVRQMLLGLFMAKDRPFHNLKILMKKNYVATFSAFMTRKSLLNGITIDCHRDVVFFDWWMLVQLSMHSKFFLDSSSFVYWRLQRESTLGKQNLELHKKRLIEFMNMLYEKINQENGTLDEQDRLSYSKRRRVLPYFLRFYQNPKIANFLPFIRRDPLWAVESVASYLINYWKYA